MPTDQILTLLIAGLSLGISILSLFYNLRRDSRKISFSIYRGSIYSVGPAGDLVGKPTTSTQIDIVNYGFIPVSISSVGGDYRDPIINKVKRIFNRKGSERYHFIFSDIRINNSLRNSDGTYKLIQPGEKISITLVDDQFQKKSSDSLDKRLRVIKDINSLYVWDVQGDKFYASKKAVKKYKKDLVDFVLEDVK